MDIVYTYVNHSDPDWRHQFKRLAPFKLSEREALLRFQDSGELRYSLRSVEKFFPDYGQIVILTNTQLPDWLRKDHPRLRVVQHSAVIDESYLPLFNSNAIESFVHLIPGLSENFLYFNDDVLLTRPLMKSDFVSENRLVFRCNQMAFRSLSDVRSSLRKHLGHFGYSEKLIAGAPRVAFAMTHAAYPVNISLMSEMVDYYRAEVEVMRKLRFRTGPNIEWINFLYPYFCVERNRASLKLTREYFVRSKDEEIRQTKDPKIGGNILRISRELMSRLLVDCPIEIDRGQMPEFACINEGVNAEVRQVIDAWFPQPSSFELSGA